MIKLLRYSIVIAMLFIVQISFAQEFIQSYIKQHELMFTQVNDIKIAYKVIGDPADPAVLMVMGLGASHQLWGDSMVRGLVDAGYRVVLFDNRDVGDSERLDEFGDPLLWWEFLKNQFGFEVNAAYTLNDMAMDSVGLMDHLQIENSHIVGASMGGMIVQIIAARYPQRTRSLTSIMSTTGAPHLPPPGGEAGDSLRNMASGDADDTVDLAAIGLHVEAMPRQLMAVFKTGDRSEEVKTISVPTLVIHGEDDTLIPPAHGEHTASLIDGSKLMILSGMGHNMPDAVLPEILTNMIQHMQAVDVKFQAESIQLVTE
jgi:pimeloyl-ACP methyl ester carboxylesterase